MDDVEQIYNEGKLLVRAMDQPIIRVKNGEKYYECDTWVNEFNSLKEDGLDSLSTTLIIPGVGVKNYKNIGFLVNADFVECFHIAKSDSGSNGSVHDCSFMANKPDFNTIGELGNYIKQNNATTMNEVNINLKLDGVVGLFINKCNNIDFLLKKIYVAKKMIYSLTEIDYPIYVYDWNFGKIELVDLSKEQEEEILSSLETNNILCWPDSLDKPYFITITNGNTK